MVEEWKCCKLLMNDNTILIIAVNNDTIRIRSNGIIPLEGKLMDCINTPEEDIESLIVRRDFCLNYNIFKVFKRRTEMVKESVTIQETVDFLNSLIKIDSSVITALFSIRMSCSKDMANHETVQVGKGKYLAQMGDKDYFQVGMIGILNGLFGVDEYGYGHIAANYDGAKIICFEVLTPEKVASFQTKEK